MRDPRGVIGTSTRRMLGSCIQFLARAARRLKRAGWGKYRLGRELIDALLLLEDVATVRRKYTAAFGSQPRLLFPRSFNEKIQRRKILRRRQHHIRLADKLAVRDFVAERVGSHVLTKLFWVGSDLQDARRQSLPRKFVLKANHSWNRNLLVRDVSLFDWGAAETLVRRWLAEDYSVSGSEWQYRWIPPMLFIEEYLEDPHRTVPLDYKFLCFNGRVEMIQVDIDRFSEHHTQALLDRNFRRLPVKFNCPQYEGDLLQPGCYHSMRDIAERLAARERFLRVDLYDVGRPMFGELTPTPGAGYGPIEPPDWDEKLGALWI